MMHVKSFIESELQTQLNPTFLQVENESHMHNVPEDAQTHFKVTLVTDAFIGKRLIQRHRLVNGLLAEALEGPVHALALHTYTSDEWQKKNGAIPLSPKCRGGE